MTETTAAKVRRCDSCKRTMEHGDVRWRDTRTGGLVCSTCLNHPSQQPNKIDVTATKGTPMQRHAYGENWQDDYDVPTECMGCGSRDLAALCESCGGVSTPAPLMGFHPDAAAFLRDGYTASKTASWKRVTAHDGGDGQVVRHCFSCGSGGVVGRSDGSVECTVCETVFTVQVQPRNVAAPQTVNGQPVHIPGMPEESEVAPSTQAAPTTEAEPGPGDVVPSFSDSDLEAFATHTGAKVDEDHYAQYLALGLPGVNRTALLGNIRQANLKTAQAFPTAFCMRCHEEDLPPSLLCRRPGQVFIDHGPDHDPELARYEGICLRCCGHNHG